LKKRTELRRDPPEGFPKRVFWWSKAQEKVPCVKEEKRILCGERNCWDALEG